MSNSGVYICEDTHASYVFNDGRSFVDYTKSLIDNLYEWYSGPNAVTNNVSDFTRHAFCISYYPGVVVIEKKEYIELETRYY